MNVNIMQAYQEQDTQAQLARTLGRVSEPLFPAAWYEKQREASLSRLHYILKDLAGHGRIAIVANAIWAEHRTILYCDQALDKFAHGYTIKAEQE